MSDSSGIKPFDVAIIGGGINGCGAAADAAMRGLSVILCERGDLASQTSSSSSKLIHGGLRYLEQFNFSLVRKALKERQTLLTIAPHLVRPLSFMLPQGKNSRPIWILRLGLFIYDHLSRSNRLLKSSIVKRGQKPDYFKPLLNSINQGVLYYDCSVDDARLTIVNALQAKSHGTKILTQTKVMHASIVDNIWHLTLKTKNQDPYLIKAKSVINAAGPWVESVNELLNIPNQQKISLVKGSHLVLQKLYEGDHAYVLQHDDKRIVFTIPYFGHTLVGTTDVPCSGFPKQLTISTLETDYLLDLVASYFGKRPKLHHIITSFSGVRPLLFEPGKNASSLTRDYFYQYTAQPAPCITIYGGKITTYRLLAKEVIDTLQPLFPLLPRSNTHITPLPGAMLGTQTIQNYCSIAHELYPWLPEAILNHYIQTYGTRTDLILKGCTHIDALGEHFGSTLYQREVDYLMNEEWATTVDDILWRRTKLGFDVSTEDTTRLNKYIILRTGTK